MWLLDRSLRKKEGKEEFNFEKIADEWLEYKKNIVKESTYYRYMLIIEKHLKPNFKDLDFNSTINYNDFIDELSDMLSSKTIRDIITVLKAILSYYQEEYQHELKIKRCNVPKLEKKQVKIFSRNEVRRLEEYCMKRKSLKDIGIIICLNTGLRIGEVCSLKWENIDLSDKKIYIENTAQRVYDKKESKSKIIIDTPKTRKLNESNTNVKKNI